MSGIHCAKMLTATSTLLHGASESARMVEKDRRDVENIYLVLFHRGKLDLVDTKKPFSSEKRICSTSTRKAEH